MHLTVKIAYLPNAVSENRKDPNKGRLPLYCALPFERSVLLEPGDRLAIPTGISIELPENIEALVLPHECLARETGTTVLNSPGTIDTDFRGEINVILVNLGSETVKIARGDLIAELKLNEFIRVNLVEVSSLSETQRGVGGLGSTGST